MNNGAIQQQEDRSAQASAPVCPHEPQRKPWPLRWWDGLLHLAGMVTPALIKEPLKRWRLSRWVWNNFRYDFQRFMKFSSVFPDHGRARLASLITIEYHRLEKGLSLAEPRVGFGAANVQSLLAHLQQYRQQFGIDRNWVTALSVINVYWEFNAQHGKPDPQLKEQIDRLQGLACDCDEEWRTGGTREVSRQQIHDAAKIDLTAFFSARHSVRQFSDERVEVSLIEKAVRMAQTTPSVCNRQTGRVHLFTSPEDNRTVLSFQNGNRGFGHLAAAVLVVTADLGGLVSVGERNQGWIDGGMFAMSLVYALHSLGLGTCCLNMSVEFPTDQALRKAVRIPDSESVIMMIAVGHLPAMFRVAQSTRRPLSEVVHVH